MSGDIGRIRHFHRVNRTVDIEGYQPILEIRIPGEPTITGTGADLTIDFDKDTTQTAEIKPLCEGDLRDKLLSELKQDTLLQQLLERTTATTGIKVPSVDQATRSVIDPSTTLLESHPLVQDLPEKFQPAGAALLEYMLKYHEIGTRDDPGGHFTAMVDPETVVLGERLPWHDVRMVLYGNRAHSRAIPWRYHEVRAILQEREILDRIIGDSKTLIDDLQADAMEEYPGEAAGLREQLKSVDLDTLSDLVMDWSSYLDSHRDQRIVRIANELEAHVDRETALDLLEVPQEAVMHPSKWLCHLLDDVREDVPPDEIRANGSYWKTTAHGTNETFESVRQRTEQQRASLIEDNFQRAFQSTFEVLTPTEDAIVRRWYSYQPTAEFELHHVRYSLIVQELFRQLRHSGIRMFNTGEKPAAVVSTSGEEPFNIAEYQRQNVDPFEQVMSGEASTDEIGKYFEYDIDKSVSYRAWNYGRQQTSSAFGFNSVNDLITWLETGEENP